MTPLAPLRILFTGIFGFVVLGLGIYCFWRYADEVQRPPQVLTTEVPLDVDRKADIDRLNTTATDERPGSLVSDPISRRESLTRDVPAWLLLVAGLLLTAFSLFGRWPLKWMARLFSSSHHAPFSPTRESGTVIDRPDGTQLHVEICGNLDGPTIVFTHGWSLDCTSWHYAKVMLSDRFRLVFWDLPGLGRSQAPNDGNFEITKMADDLHVVVTSVSNSKPVYLVGHSIGGMISQIYSGQHVNDLREYVAGIVLVHTTFTNPLRTMLGAPLWSAIEKVVIVPAQYLMIALAPLAWLSNWHSYLNGSMQTTTRMTSFTGKQSFQQVDYASWLSTKAWPGVVARGNLAMFRYDAQSELRKLDVPLLVIGGQHDRVTKAIASDRINEIATGSETLRNPGGHLALLEFHEEVMGGIARFVEKQESASRETSEALTA